MWTVRLAIVLWAALPALLAFISPAGAAEAFECGFELFDLLGVEQLCDLAFDELGRPAEGTLLLAGGGLLPQRDAKGLIRARRNFRSL